MKTRNLLFTNIIIFVLSATSVFAQPDWKRVNYETSTVFTGIVSLNGNNATVNDMVGIFVNGECRMMTKVIIVNDSSFVSAVIHSSGVSEVAVIKFWDSQTNTIYDIDTVVAVEDHGSVKRFPIIVKSGSIVEVPSEIEPQQEKFEVFPSPFTSTIHIQSSKVIKSVAIYNSIGKELKFIDNVSLLNTSVETNNLANGLYLVSVEFIDGSVVTKKVFKK
jgi:hypothetical protein